MSKIYIQLSNEEFICLANAANKEIRSTKDQARHLLRLALGLDSPQKHETATPAFPGTGSGFVTPHP
jgi:hypothetical protein